MAGTKKNYQKDWASLNWFEAQVDKKNSLSSYFAHDKNGYQIFRHEEIISVLNLCKNALNNDSFLDIGCADGFLTNKVFKQYNFNEGHGVDFLESIVELGKEKYPNIKFRVCSIDSINFNQNSFDLIIMSEVLYYIKTERQKNILEDIKNKLKPNGLLLISSVFGDEYFFENDLINLLKPNFSIIQKKYLFMKIFNIITKPFFYFNRLNYFISNNAEPASEYQRKRFIRYKRIFYFPFVSIMISFLSTLSQGVLKSTNLPKLCNYCGRIFSASSIIVISKVNK